MSFRHLGRFRPGRPWLYNQADPSVLKRALTMARSTPWPGPLLPDS